MDWELRESEALGGAEGMEAFLRRLEGAYRDQGGPLEGFTFLSDAREMLRISREIEESLLKQWSRSTLYVGFQNSEKFSKERARYERLRSGDVSVHAFGEGTPDGAMRRAADGWYSLPANHRKLENQWYLVTKRPSPIAFVGWEISDEMLWGREGVSHPDKQFVGFVSEDPRVVQAIVGHLNTVRASRQGNTNAGGSLREVIADLAPRRILVPVDDGRRPEVGRSFRRLVQAGVLEGCDVYLYDLAAASYFIDPYPHVEDRRPFDVDYIRNAVRREYLASQMEQVEAAGPVLAILPLRVGFGEMGRWVRRQEIDLVLLPQEFEEPGLMDRLKRNTVSALREAANVTVLLDGEAGTPRVLESRPIALAV